MAFIVEAPNFIWGNHFFDAKSHQCIWERTATFGYTFFIGVILIAGKVILSVQPFLRKVYIFHLILLGLCGGACPVASRGLRNYRPHPKDGEGTVFTGVCLSTVGYPSPRFFPWSLVPGPFWVGGTSVLFIWNWGTPPVETGDPLTQKTDQHSEYLLRGGQYVFCGHAGGLSCCNCFHYLHW